MLGLVGRFIVQDLVCIDFIKRYIKCQKHQKKMPFMDNRVV